MMNGELNMDPWQPLNCSNSSDGDLDNAAHTAIAPVVFPQFDGRKTMDSSQYLSKIEAKLKRIKGCSKSPASKDIIAGLDQIRTAQLHAASLDHESSLPYLRNSDYVEDVHSSSTIVDTVRRRIAPEKQALNEEELRSLIENDELCSKVMELYSTEQSSETVSAESCVPSDTVQ